MSSNWESEGPKKTNNAVKATMGLIAVAVLLTTCVLVCDRFVRFATSESKLSGIRSAYIVLVTRYAQMVESGRIYGESPSFPERALPVWHDRVTDTYDVNCDAKISYPDYGKDGSLAGGMRNYMLLVVGPSSQSAEQLGRIAILYPGKGLEFNDILKSPRLEEVFSATGRPSAAKMDLDEAISGDQVERADQRELYHTFIKGREIHALSEECSEYSYTVFTFTE